MVVSIIITMKLNNSHKKWFKTIIALTINIITIVVLIRAITTIALTIKHRHNDHSINYKHNSISSP